MSEQAIRSMNEKAPESPPRTATYQDFADKEEISLSRESGRSIFTSKQHEQSFPNKLHYILDQLDKDGMSHVAHWAVHGRCFYVVDRDEFVQKVLRLWFDMTKFTSFQRQLNIYGFKRIFKGKDKGGYYHELFLRGKPSLVDRIPRIQIKGNGPYRGINGKAKDPDFASMPSLPITTRGHDKGNTGKIDNGRNGVHYLTDAAAINSRTSMALRIAQNQTRQQMTGMQSMHGVAASTLSLDFPLVVPQVSTRIPTLPESLHGIEAERRLFHGLMTAGGFRHSRLHTSAEMQFRNLLRQQIIESLLNSAGPARF